MWQLRMRRNKTQEWVELGAFENMLLAARRVLELEGDALGSVFFRVYVDPLYAKSDAEMLSRLEYQSDKGFYLLTRHVQ